MKPIMISEDEGRTTISSLTKPEALPLITIVTSTFNAESELPWTAESIGSQTYPHIQWVIVDGASKDATIDVIKKYEHLVDKWLSEPDDGIYDAWNKALTYAKGDWIQFLGAGDELASPDTLATVAETLTNAYPAHDLVYGNLMYISQNDRIPLESVGQPWPEMESKWELFRPKLPIHPAVFHHKFLFTESAAFDTRFKIAGDSHFLMKQIRKKPPLYVDVLVDKMPLGGVSGEFLSVLDASVETRLAARELGFRPPLRHQTVEHVKLFVKKAMCHLMPVALVLELADLWRVCVGKKRRWTR